MTHPLDDRRRTSPGPTLVLVDDSDGLALDALQGIEDVPGIEPQVVTLSSLSGPLKGWGSVLVVAADRSRLRRMASAVPLLGQCKASPAGSPTHPRRGCSCRVRSGRGWCTSPPARPATAAC